MDGQAALVQGYRKKPRWIIILAVAFIAAPLFNHLMTMAIMGVPAWYRPSVFLSWMSYMSIESFLLSLLVISAGVALLLVRRWAWILALSTLGVMLIYSVLRFEAFWKLGPLFLLTMLMATLGAVAVLYSERFRQPYLNPRIRWWETSPRYQVNLPVRVSDHEMQAQLVDISRSGVLLEWANGEDIPELSDRVVVELNEAQHLQLPATVARKTPRGYGLAFNRLDRGESRALQRFIHSLASPPRR